MPRKKKVSDELYNLRRRLNRNIASLEKSDRLTEGQRSNLEYFKQMREELTTIRGQRSASDILHSESAQKLKWRLENALQRQGIRGEQRRRLDFEKDVFSASLQEAGRKSDSTPSRASLQAVVFMQATKQHWQGLPADPLARQKEGIAWLFLKEAFCFWVYWPLLCPPICRLRSLAVAASIRSIPRSRAFGPKRCLMSQTACCSLRSLSCSLGEVNSSYCRKGSRETLPKERLSFRMGAFLSVIRS